MREKDKFRMSGVYRISNIVNGKFYIGSSAYIKSRRSSHFLKLCKGIHTNKHLQFAYTKYGASNFIFEVIEFCEPLKCVEREQYYIDMYSPTDRKVGYNTRTIADSQLGTKRSEESRKRISEGHKGIKQKPESILKSIESRKWYKPSEETKEKIRKGNLGRKLSEKQRNQISESNRGRKMSERHKIAMAKGRDIFYQTNPCGIKISQYSSDGLFIKSHVSIKAAAVEIGAKTTGIWRVLRGLRKTTRGFIFKYAA